MRWIHAKIEEAPLGRDYGLAVAGASFHWFDADRVLPLLAECLAPGAVLALCDGDAAWDAPWIDAELPVFHEFVSRLEGRPVSWEKQDVEAVRFLEHSFHAADGAQ